MGVVPPCGTVDSFEMVDESVTQISLFSLLALVLILCIWSQRQFNVSGYELSWLELRVQILRM